MRLVVFLFIFFFSRNYQTQTKGNLGFYMKPNVSNHGTFGNAIGINSNFIESDIGINAIFLVNRLSSQTILKMDIKSFKLG